MSRVPALNEKALMGVRASFSEIAFDIILPVADSQPLWERVAKSAINWGYTNWKGMTFGLLFAAAILNFLSVLSRREFKNRYLNTILGVITGAPLGVCVNCATPIAQGMHASGARIETSLAALISSPTLNVIVLSMTFTLLPLELAVGKLLAVAAFILSIPLLVKLSNLDTENSINNKFYSISSNSVVVEYSWMQSIKIMVNDFFKNLLYIIKIALPLMLLAGVIGALAIELFPFSQLNDFEVNFVNIFGLALVGVFLPVPIAFDVLTSVALLSAGTSTALVAVLLFSLGSFSVYPFLMIAKNISLRLAVYLAVAAIFISVVFGFTIKEIGGFQTSRYDQQLMGGIEKMNTPKKVKFENSKIVQNTCQQLPENLHARCMVNYILNPDHLDQINEQCSHLPKGFSLDNCLPIKELAMLQANAIASGDVSLCVGLLQPKLRSQCVYSVTTQLAVKSYNINKCNDLNNKGMIQACRNQYIHQGLKFQVDGSVCNDIDDVNEKEICINNLNIIRYVEYGDLEACNDFSDLGFKRHCLYSVASRIVGQSGDVSVCNLLSDVNLIQRCNALLYVRRAKNLTDYENCYLVKFDKMKNSCLLDVAKLKIHKAFEALSLGFVNSAANFEVDKPVNKSQVGAGKDAPELKFEIYSDDSNVEIKHHAFKDKNNTSRISFKKVSSVDMGVSKVWKVKSLDFFEPFFMGKGIASGDFNNDHWPDLVIATESGIAVYKNIGGKFSLLKFSNDLAIKNIFLVAFVDIDNNGYQDVFASTYGGENVVVFNNGHDFTKSTIQIFKGRQKLTVSAGFSDIDNNGFLDMVLGNWSNGAEKYFNPEVSQNVAIYNMRDKFVNKRFLEPKGETLSVLLSDLNDDANIDVVFANDHLVPDMYYLSNENSELSLLKSSSSIISSVPRNTMSVDSADFNNDMQLDVFSVDMIFSEGSSDRYCENIENNSAKTHCVELLEIYDAMKGRGVSRCEKISNIKNRNNCYSSFAMMAARTSYDDKFCEHLKGDLSAYNKLCVYLSKPAAKRERIDFSDYLVQKQKNVLLMSGGGKFVDKAREYGVDSSYWSWNSKAADLDNDQWQDIYVGNGYHFGDGFYEIHENILFHNINGERFEQTQKKWGLDDKLNTSSYTYADFDLDGDIDIIATSFMEGVTFYINSGNKNNSITLKLIDSVTNINAVGAQVSIFYGDGLKQIREIKLSGGFMSFDNPLVYFGLAGYDEVKQLIIRWPDGVKTTIDSPLTANKIYTIHRKK